MTATPEQIDHYRQLAREAEPDDIELAHRAIDPNVMEMRMDRAYRTLLVYGQYSGTDVDACDEAATADLITDLLHNAEGVGMSVDDILRYAIGNYNAERGEP